MDIRQLRQDRKLTLKQVADILGISSVQLSRIERNSRGLKVSYAKKLGELYGVKWMNFYNEEA